MNAAIKTGFVLLSSVARPLPSTRIAALNMFPFLRAAGFDPHVAFELERASETPELGGLATRLQAEGYQLVVFQKVRGPSVEAAVAQLSAAGIATVYSVCDLVDARLAELTDATVVVTDFLKSLYPAALRHKIHVVHDGIEMPELSKDSWRSDRGAHGDPLHALLITSARLDKLPQMGAPPGWLDVEIVGGYAKQPRGAMRSALHTFARKASTGERLAYLGFLTDRRIRCVSWSPEHVRKAMAAADIGIIPIDSSRPTLPGRPAPIWKVKSENRLTMKMSAGLPVVATPIPSYEAVIEHGVNGFFARSRRDWQDCLERLRDPDLRREMGARARQSVAGRYSMQAQAAALVAVLRGLARSAA